MNIEKELDMYAKINGARLAAIIGLTFETVLTFIVFGGVGIFATVYGLNTTTNILLGIISFVIIFYVILFVVYCILIGKIKKKIKNGIYTVNGLIYASCVLSLIFGGFIGICSNVASLGIVKYELTQLRYLDGTYTQERPLLKLGLADNYSNNLKTRFKILLVIEVVVFIFTLFNSYSDIGFLLFFNLMVAILAFVLFLYNYKKLYDNLLQKNVNVALSMTLAAIGAGYAGSALVGYAVLVIGLLAIKDVTNLQTTEELDKKSPKQNTEQHENVESDINTISNEEVIEGDIEIETPEY